MRKSNASDGLSNFVKNMSVAFCFLIFCGTSFWVLSDLQYYSFGDESFGLWQIPLGIVIVVICFSFLIYLKTKGKILLFILMTIVYVLGVNFIPYEKYGDFKRLREIAFCEQDGRLCRENLYPYLTKAWCLDNGYKFYEISRFCKKRID